MIDELLGKLVFNIIEPKPEDTFQEGLIVDIIKGKVVVTMNKNKAYRVLAKRDLIVAGLNKKLAELVQRKIESLALDEENMEKDK